MQINSKLVVIGIIGFAIAMTFMQSSSQLVLLILLVAGGVIIFRLLNRSSQSANDQQLIAAAEPMLQLMQTALGKEIKQRVEVVGYRVKAIELEITLLIGDGLLEGYEERITITHAKISDLKVWQQITRDLIATYRAHSVAAKQL